MKKVGLRDIVCERERDSVCVRERKGEREREGGRDWEKVRWRGKG